MFGLSCKAIGINNKRKHFIRNDVLVKIRADAKVLTFPNTLIWFSSRYRLCQFLLRRYNSSAFNVRLKSSAW